MARLLTVEIRFDQDVVLARQRTRQIAQLLGFEPQDQVRITTAVSEIVRNAFQYAGGGAVDFQLVNDRPPTLVVCVRDHGPGITDTAAILQGRSLAEGAGAGMGILGARRLMDRFELTAPSEGGVRVVLEKHLPARTPTFSDQQLASISADLFRFAPSDPLDEIQRQNGELMRILDELRANQADMAELNRELQETNRGVVALYAELAERADSLRKVSELKTHFLSNMSHEFRTPLNSILNLSQFLLDRLDGDLTEEQEKQVLFVRQCAQSLAVLVDDLLDLAKVEAGKLEVRCSRFTVVELFGALRGMLRPLLSQSSPTLTFEQVDDLPELHTDEGKLSQILRNFIANALKYTEHGEVRVAARVIDNERVEFSVADTGIGIAEEDQERVFQDFTQVDGPLQRKVKGTGLGLPLSRKLANLLGGNVSLDSQLGVGSTFRVTIPREYAADAGNVIEKRPLPQEFAELHSVLVIDDTASSRYLTRDTFAAHGCEVREAVDGSSGLEVARAWRPQLIVLDINLPDRSGFEVLQQLRNDAITAHISVIIYSTQEITDAEIALLTMRGAFFLPKNQTSRPESEAAFSQVIRAAGFCFQRQPS